MSKIAGIRFHKGGRIYYFDSGSFDLKKGDIVMVNTSFGDECGEISIIKEISSRESKRNLMPVIKVFDEKDRELFNKKEKEKKSFLKTANDLVEKNNLQMKILDVNLSLDDSKVTFIFSSESRIDFRQLVKDLASKLKKQVVLRQIGPRDEARLLGGFGRCGRVFCCQSFLQNLESITIDMAKVQNLAGRGSSKISGVCGKLMCCLAYEVDVYKELIKGLPEIGEKLKTKKGLGTVIDQNIIKQTVLVEIDKDKTKIEMDFKEKEEEGKDKK
uniref:Stage 0 sporulation protein n=1 Tax=candidate division CPR3 bacterium TaxID=2268181 RepID=A0A7C4R1X3_UNCC3